MLTRPFEDLVRDRTGSDFVERDWLRERIEQALALDGNRYVLVTGEPGAGKTSLLAGLARTRPNWLRYFVRRDSRTALAGGDIQSFLLSIGHQLAGQRPEIFQRDRLEVVVRQHIDTVEAGGHAVGIRIADLTVSPFQRTATLALEQRITKVATGSVTGIEIGTANLEPRLLEPDNLAHLALIDPAEVLLAEDQEARIVILVDALDELAGEPASLLRWLARGLELPANVRLVLTSRPHAALEPLRSSRADQLHEVAIDPGSRLVVDDLTSYAERALDTDAIAHAAREGGHDPEELRRNAVVRAAGNFLYLVTYARALTEAASTGEGDVLTRLLASAELPPGLGGLYAFFIATAHVDLDRLGMLEIRDPIGANDRLTPAWEGVGQPVLGVLTVAREPLTVAELTALGGIRVWPGAVRNVLARLRWLLEPQGDRVAFYHASVGEFLAAEHTAREHPDYAVDELEWHERIVQHYRGAASSWTRVDWSTVDRYGLMHLAEHAVRCRVEVADEAVELVCGGLRRAIRAGLGSDRHFLRLLGLVTGRVIDRFPLATGLPTVLYLGVVRRQVLRGMRSLAPAVLGLLARLGHTDEALEHLAALPPSLQQFEAALEIVKHSRPHRAELFDMMVETALTVPTDEAHDGNLTGESRHPLKRAARALAPHDLTQALRLWERANAIGRNEAADPLFRAAAEATSTITVACELVASIRADRAGAHLDLAARAEPAEVAGLLRLAEESLPDAQPADQLRGRARLAAAAARAEPDAARRHLAALRAAVDQETADPSERTIGIVAAAGELTATDRATATALLDRLDAVELNGLVDDAFLRAATLRVELGQLDRAQALLDRLVTWNNTVWTKVRVSTVVARFDLAEALRMIERAHATTRANDPRQGMGGQLFRESELQAVALELAKYNPDRAVTVANEMTDVGWSSIELDRYTVLARIAHERLDTGDAETAQAILAQILRSTEPAPPLVDERRFGPYYPAAGSQRADRIQSPADRAEHLPFLMNHTRDWMFLSERRFYRDPADLIRAMAPGSWSIGNPYCLARTVRVFAETIADTDVLDATALVESITDAGERTIGMAALFRSAASSGMNALADQLWTAVRQQLADIPPFEWLVDNQDDYAFAYVRPDHRTRFEAAIRLIPYEADTGRQLLGQAGTGYLQHAFQLSFMTYASGAYATSLLRGTAAYPLFQGVHENVLTQPPVTNNGDRLLDITRAMVAFHEFLISPQQRRAAAMVIEDPVYAAVVDLVTPTDREPVSDAFIRRVRTLLSGPRLPAAAGLVAFAADLWPHSDRARQLATEIIAASEGREALHVVTLVRLATSPILGDLVDPVELLAKAQRLPPSPTTRVEQDETMTRLFPILVGRQPPTVALRLLHDSVLENWSTAMALLEHAAEPLVAALGLDVVNQLTDAILRALACVSPDDTAPAEIDGVRLPIKS